MVNRVQVPSNPFIFRLFREKKVPIHIIRHSVKVYYVSNRLSSVLPGELGLNAKLIGASALLHDICKMDSIINGGDHARKGAELLDRLGYPEVGEIIRQHVHLDKPVDKYARINEAIIVNYADKRVRHTEIVSLEERFEDIVERYAKTKEAEDRIWRLFEESKNMERLIFSHLSVEPDTLFK